MEIVQELISWYEDGGYVHVEEELVETIQSHLTEA
jgi:hypothetical protein